MKIQENIIPKMGLLYVKKKKKNQNDLELGSYGFDSNSEE